MSIFKRMLTGRAATDVRPTEDDRRALTITPEDMSMTIIGYSPEELRELLAIHREHTTLMLNMLHAAQTAGDAVRYRPGPSPIGDEES